MTMNREQFEELRFLPDPLMQDDGHYLPFEKAFTSNTTEQDRPSLRGKSLAKPLSFSPSVQHAKNTDTMVQCEECNMWRLVFSKKKLSPSVRTTLESILEDVSYTCGASFNDLDLPESLASIIIRDHRCGDIIERLYYSAGYEDICIYCATTSDLAKNLPPSIYPMCNNCKDEKEPIQKKNNPRKRKNYILFFNIPSSVSKSHLLLHLSFSYIFWLFLYFFYSIIIIFKET